MIGLFNYYFGCVFFVNEYAFFFYLKPFDYYCG